MRHILEPKQTKAMGTSKPFVVVLLCCVLVVAAATPEATQAGAISTYIVHVASSHSPRATRNAARLTRAYSSFLGNNLPMGIREPAPSILYSYAHAMTGFAARLTAHQATHLEAQPSILAVTPDRVYELHTTHSSTFLGLTPYTPLIMESNNATDIVIGVVDSGIYPNDRASFAADPSIKKPPRCFRGGCVSTPDFDATKYCNNKLVGAKFFHKGHMGAMIRQLNGSAPATGSPLDYTGHGTSTASIAAGAPVSGASFSDSPYGLGTAKGTASGARIASYNVCVWIGCRSSDIVAAIDEAIRDNVDVLSMSFGSFFSPHTLHDDPVSAATFRAARAGIFVSTSAGNSGPQRATLSNVEPWVLTVGASTMDRDFPAPVVLGNGKSFWGFSLYYGPDDPPIGMRPLVYGGDCGGLKPSITIGRIVLCDEVFGRDGVAQGYDVKQAGGVGAIISTPDAPAKPYLLPAVSVTYVDFEEMKEYSRTRNPVAEIKYFSQHMGLDPPSPRVARFSSRGPSRVAPELLKPDIIAPGVEILVAWTGEASPSGLGMDTRRVKFNIISGTSVAAPHLSGIAAMMKAARPEWSPSVIKSALMTTAYQKGYHDRVIMDMYTGKDAGPFEYGAGHVEPDRVLNPGLVYDADEGDYISFLCALGYTPRQIAIFTGDDSKKDSCLEYKDVTVGDHNYPSFSVAFKPNEQEVRQRRVVRNVGSNVDAVYTCIYKAPKSVDINVYPTKLVFDAQHQTLEYTIIVTRTLSSQPHEGEEHNRLVWWDGQHRVGSSIAITWPASTVAAVATV